MPFRRGVFQAKCKEAELEKAHRLVGGGVASPYQIANTTRSASELPRALADSLYQKGFGEVVFDVVEHKWHCFVAGEGRLTLKEDLEDLGLSLSVQAEIKAHFYCELARLRFVWLKFWPLAVVFLHLDVHTGVTRPVVSPSLSIPEFLGAIIFSVPHVHVHILVVTNLMSPV